MVSKLSISRSLEIARRDLATCWDVLSEGKENAGKSGTHYGQRLIDLQIELIRILFSLDKLYRDIVAEKKRLISRKESYDYQWFRRRMNSLDTCRNAVIQTIGLSKFIGDGYAWIFYKDTGDLLEEHSKAQRQILPPPGVGGIGERAFTEKAQGLGGHFILYHGITSFLNLGDISLINMSERKAKTIGELKTQRTGKNTYSITLGYVSGQQADPLNLSLKSDETKAAGPAPTKPAPPLSPKIRQALDKQMKRLTEAIRGDHRDEDHFRADTIGEYYFEQLEALIERTPLHSSKIEQMGPGLLVATLRLSENQSNPLHRSSKGSDWATRKLAGLEQHAITICNKKLDDNCLFIGNLMFDEFGFPRYMVGGIPAFWWPMKRETIRDLIFGNVLVFTVYNPAHLWQMLRDRGFEVTIGERSKFICARRTVDDVVTDFRNFDYFSNMAQCQLMSDETIVSMVDLTIDQIKEADLKTGTKVRIKPIVRLK